MSSSNLLGGAQRSPKVIGLEVALGCSLLEAVGLAHGLQAWGTETEPSGRLTEAGMRALGQFAWERSR